MGETTQPTFTGGELLPHRRKWANVEILRSSLSHTVDCQYRKVLYFFLQSMEKKLCK